MKTFEKGTFIHDWDDGCLRGDTAIVGRTQTDGRVLTTGDEAIVLRVSGHDTRSASQAALLPTRAGIGVGLVTSF